jgi:hydroxymethylbilane synthase
MNNNNDNLDREAQVADNSNISTLPTTRRADVLAAQPFYNDPEAARRAAQPRVAKHQRPLPLRVGTRASPLALIQTRNFLSLLTRLCPVLRGMDVFQERVIQTTGDAIQDRRLAEIGGKGLFAKEIHEALLDGRVDFAVHSLKDLETNLPDGISLACTLKREDARDVLILPDEVGKYDPQNPYDVLPECALIGTSSVRRQAQLLHARPDLRIALIRGSVQSRLGKIRDGQYEASLLALAGLRRLDLEHEASVILDPSIMVPSAAQGIVGITVRTDDAELRSMLFAIEDPEARAVSTAERAMLRVLDGSCATPIGGHARLQADGSLILTGLVARSDGSFLCKRTISGLPADAERIGRTMGAMLRADSPCDVFA